MNRIHVMRWQSENNDEVSLASKIEPQGGVEEWIEFKAGSTEIYSADFPIDCIEYSVEAISRH